MDMRSDVVKMFFSLGWKGAYSLVQEKILGKVWLCFKCRDSTKVTYHFLVVFESFSSMASQLYTQIPLDSLSPQRPLGSHEFWGCGKCEFPWSNSKSRILGSQGLALFGHGHLGCITFYALVLWWDGWAGLYTTSSYLQIPWDTPVNKDRIRKQDLLKISEN